MARGYSHIQKYEKEIIERIEKGETLREIGEAYGFTYQQMQEDKVAQLRYIIDRKDARIKSLEMENELMRDFLSLTERK